MCKEISSWKLVVNCLYAASEPISIKDDFVNYVSYASKRIRKMGIKGVVVDDNPCKIEGVIYFEDPFITIKNGLVMLAKKQYDKEKYFDIINIGLSEDIKKGLKKLTCEVYNEFKKDSNINRHATQKNI